MPTVIGPRTQLCGVILHPAGHTRSPAMHNAAFAALGIDAFILSGYPHARERDLVARYVLPAIAHAPLS